jgi:hypothetical protein
MQRCGQIRRIALYRARRGELSRRLPAWRLLRRADGFPASNDGALQLDVRLTLQTDDGAPIFMTYRGIRHGREAILARLSKGEAVDPSEYYFRIAPFFETGAAKYAWLNNIISVGYGERLAKGPRYTIFEIL